MNKIRLLLAAVTLLLLPQTGIAETKEENERIKMADTSLSTQKEILIKAMDEAIEMRAKEKEASQ